MNRRNKNVTTYFVLFALLLIGIVYAILQANLQINGVAKIKSNTWDVHFNNIQVNENSVSIETGDSAATIDPENNCKVDFEVTLSLPGDFYEFTVDVVNAGSIDAMIGTLNKTLKVNDVVVDEVPDYLDYTVTYGDGAEILENHLLSSGDTETYLVRLEFKSDIEELPEATTISTSLAPQYIQADSSAIKIFRVEPSLTEGLIPVKIANDGTVTAVSKKDNSWYDYDNKIWANAVLTTSTNRSTYQAIANGTGTSTTIPESEILAYYVWIPRYSYKIWTLDASQSHTGEEQTIDIQFVDTNTKDIGTTVGSYYTHPAFTFGDAELSGFWAGKFETSADTSSTCYASPSNANCNNTNQSPRIVPNVDSLRVQSIENEFATSLKFAGGSQSGRNISFSGNSTYGLTSSADSHLMKNSEWGAILYLSHSNYGINGDIRINNYETEPNSERIMTGCGASTTYAAKTSTCDIVYGEATSYPQSTTGNISGIFDMAGGALEYVMGLFEDTTNNCFSGDLPESKYYDNYPESVFVDGSNGYSTNVKYCTLSTCGGHALFETRGWYGNKDEFVFTIYKCFIRSSTYFSGNYRSGLFNSTSYGGPSTTISWRSALVTS